ncbi:multidrug effflux MFS transporter [Cocleimonas sp. KMM 6892]|uniref:multidrug effflux MFS transporter n=1 Tax=unclassified Cocleimonas TaxID=2639732 RepID=UPI002DB89628|nr:MULTISPECIES: multidrug effflux MFS transporter [unclassified Cocleimonas]MEB8433183.1 multidrug effflux MFS transporter [Cocleimonas sp. KMM 6892]MEC4715836.1 multidrug effflux MFS transporter [Cocleimonas sp. KMM 6895]MEC4745297.1 multidrug effflux MFS transporter [Cocleimonas sp. KMM 6896]
MKATAKALSRIEYIILMSVVVAVDALAIDAILPALSFISNEFGVQDGNSRQYIVTTILMGYGFGVLIFGIASDSFGRKRPVYIGFAIFLIGTLVTIFASSFSMLLVGRALQGFGAAGPQIIPTAITRDLYKGRGMAQIMSLIMMVFMLVPAIAPLIGQGILMLTNWQGVFAMLGIYAVFAWVWFSIRLPETLPVESRVPFSFSQAWSSVKEVLRNKQAVKFTIAEGLAFGAILAYLSTAQQIFQEHFELGDRFALYFGSLALVMMFASFVNSRLVEKLGMHKMVLRAAMFLFFVSIIYVVYIWLNDTSVPLWSFLIYASISYFCLGILFGNMHSLAMEEVGHVAGAAASVIGSCSTLMSVIIAAFIGSFYNDSVTPIVIGFGVLMLPIIYITWKD